MSRFLLLFLFLLWMAWAPTGPVSPREMTLEISVFLGFFALIVLVMGGWGRLLARTVTGKNLHRSLKRFNKTIFAARLMVLAWFGVGVFVLGWGSVVQYLLGPVRDWPLQLPGMLIATFPAMLAWMGLWWSQFPADRALREQSLMIQLDDGLPIHAPPSMSQYFRSNLRLQLLFTIVPVALILLGHDLVFGALWKLGLTRAGNENVHAAVSLGSAVLVMLLAPEILRRVLHTQPLPESPLRTRLEAMCRRSGLRYREILLWRTENNMGNAAVMGLVPQVRYILLSDLLLETMTDAQVEAVFAHELGHIVHRHMAWYVVFFGTLFTAGIAAEGLLGDRLSQFTLPPWLPTELVSSIGALGVFFLAFGFLSRRFERQADVFAARTIERRESSGVTTAFANPDDPSTAFEAHGLAGISNKPAPDDEPKSYVGEYGATVFASALHRVAVINNIPIKARSWCHGSIAKRMQYLRELAADPARTARFDRVMTALYLGLLGTLIACSAWVAFPLVKGAL